MAFDFERDDLWQRLSGMSLDEAGVPVPLTERLRIETGLDAETIRCAVEEYKKYIYLAVRCQMPVEMPPLADKVWRTHLTYTRHYWDYMCADVIGQDVHYPRTTLRKTTSQDLDGAELSSEAYRKTFGYEPPAFLSGEVPKASSSSAWQGFLIFLVFGAALFSTGILFPHGFFILLAAMFAYWFLATIAEMSPHVTGGFAVAHDVDAKVVSDQMDALRERVGSYLLGSSYFQVELAADTRIDAAKREQLVDEYVKFLCIKKFADFKVTPSVEVDKIWHLHVLHSEHYREILCKQILEEPFHHDPACGRQGEWDRFRAQYLRTLAHYQALFRKKPKATIWPVGLPRRFQKALSWGVGAAAAGLVVLDAVPSVGLWAGIVPSLLVGGIGAAVSTRRVPDDAAITRAEIRGRGKSTFEIGISGGGGCGGCGGCGG